MALIPGGNFMMMPLTIGSLPLDIAFFIGGCIASSKRSDWFYCNQKNLDTEEGDENFLSIVEGRQAFFATTFISVGLFAFNLIHYFGSVNHGHTPAPAPAPAPAPVTGTVPLTPSPLESPAPSSKAPSPSPVKFNWGIIPVTFWIGTACFAISFYMLDFFSRRFDFKTERTAVFAKVW